MGEYQFRMPDIGEGVVEGEVVTWHVERGDFVSEDDPILDVMTDKATVTIPSPVDGKVLSTNGAAGEIIAVGSVCIVFEVDGEGTPVAEEKPAGHEPELPAEPAEPASEEEVGAETEEAGEPASPTPASAASSKRQGKVLASPAVRLKAREAGVELADVTGSGPAGRITRSDLDALLAGAVPSAAVASAAAVHPAGESRDGVTEVPVIGLRRKIAEQMSKSYSSIAHFSYFEEVDVTRLEELRSHLNAGRDEGQPKLTYLPFIMQALVKSLAEHPLCNAHYLDEEGKVLRFEAINLGIATQTDKGLCVPVVKHVEALDIWGCASEMLRVSSAARDGTATLEELSGSTFTITSLGKMGGLGATPIINHPEVGILGVHRAAEAPVVVDDEIVIRRMLRLSSSWDHRVVDGWDGAMLIQTLKGYLEHPATIFM